MCSPTQRWLTYSRFILSSSFQVQIWHDAVNVRVVHQNYRFGGHWSNFSNNNSEWEILIICGILLPAYVWHASILIALARGHHVVIVVVLLSFTPGSSKLLSMPHLTYVRMLWSSLRQSKCRSPTPISLRRPATDEASACPHQEAHTSNQASLKDSARSTSTTATPVGLVSWGLGSPLPSGGHSRSLGIILFPRNEFCHLPKIQKKKNSFVFRAENFLL
jgi:hypothetical protein